MSEFCTLFKAEEGRIIFDRCDAVDRNHRHGPTADSLLLHAPGALLPPDRTMAFGLMRGSMITGETWPCGHPEGVPDAA